MCQTNVFWKTCMKLLQGQGVSSALYITSVYTSIHKHILSLKSTFNLILERMLNTHGGQLIKNMPNQLSLKNYSNKEGNYQWSLCFTAQICYRDTLLLIEHLSPQWPWNIFTYVWHHPFMYFFFLDVCQFLTV